MCGAILSTVLAVVTLPTQIASASDTDPATSNNAVPKSSVGVGAQINQIVIPGPELEAKPIDDRKSPMVVRVTGVFRHGTDYRYDLEYYGLEPGQFNLRDYLQRKDRSSMNSVPLLPVEVVTHLPPGQILPSDLVSRKLPFVGGYRLWGCVAVGLWMLVTLWLLLARRRAMIASAVVEQPPSIAERLRPLVMEAIAGRLTSEKSAELERLLLGYWRGRLGLIDADPVVAVSLIREHPEAGVLLRAMEDWLHRPGGAKDVDVTAMLAPYQNVSDDTEASPIPAAMAAQGT
jgi:hypothetical protein